MLKDRKVLLRPVKKRDISLFLKWFNDPEVIQYLSMYLPMTELGEEKWIDDLCLRRVGIDVVFVIQALLDKKIIPIGSCGIHNINPKDKIINLVG